MKSRLTNLLRLANLRDEEIVVYLLLLKLKHSTSSELAEKSGLNSMMVYRTLKRLHDKELVDEKKLNQKQNIYSALSLNALISRLNHMQKNLQRLQNSLKNLDTLLPFIDFNKDDNESVEIRDGIDAFREEYLKFPKLCGPEFLHVGSMENCWKTGKMGYESPEERYFINTRLKNGIYARVLDKISEEMERVQAHDSLEKRVVKLKKKLPIMNNYLAIGEDQCSLFICDDKNPRVMLIREPELVRLHKDQFESLWKS